MLNGNWFSQQIAKTLSIFFYPMGKLTQSHFVHFKNKTLKWMSLERERIYEHIGIGIKISNINTLRNAMRFEDLAVESLE